MKWKGILVPTHQVGPSLRTATSTAVCHTLGILMLSRKQIQPDPAAQHTHDCLLGRRERVKVRAGLTIPRRVQQGQPCWQFDSGWFLDLPYCVVAIRQVLNTGDVHCTRQHAANQSMKPHLAKRGRSESEDPQAPVPASTVSELPTQNSLGKGFSTAQFREDNPPDSRCTTGWCSNCANPTCPFPRGYINLRRPHPDFAVCDNKAVCRACYAFYSRNGVMRTTSKEVIRFHVAECREEIPPGSRSEFAHGGLQLPFDQMQHHAFAFDLEVVQTETTLDSHATPPRPAYDVIQTALISPDNTVCMRCVLLWLCTTNCLFVQ